MHIALTFANLDHWLTRRLHACLWIVPLITLALVFTNPWHHLVWTDFTPSPKSSMYIFQFGTGFWPLLAYYYVVNLASAGILVWVTLRRQHIYRRQALALLLSYPLPWISNLVYTFTNGTLETGFNYTPLTFTLGSAILLWGFYRHRSRRSLR